MRPSGVVALVGCFILLVLGLTWIGQGNDFFLLKVFAPKYEQVRYDTFKQSQAYNDGMAQQLQGFAIAYADPNTSLQHKEALAASILHQFADYDDGKLPPHLGTFLRQLRLSRMSPAR